MKQWKNPVFFVFLAVFLVLASAMCAPLKPARPGDLAHKWVEGEWRTRSGIFTLDLKVVNGNEVDGYALFQQRYEGIITQGQVLDSTVNLTIDFPAGRFWYEFKKHQDGTLRGPAPDSGRTIILRRKV